MIGFVQTWPVEFAWALLVAGFCLGASTAYLYLERAVRPEPSEPEHECPFCGRTLRAITVRCLDELEDPIPPDAEWICRNDSCEAYYFADRRDDAKPAPAEEV